MTNHLGLAHLNGRCADGFAPVQHPRLCPCGQRQPAGTDEWSTFLAAVRSAARDGMVRQADVRPLIRGRVEPKHIGQLYRRARNEGLLIEVDHERSNDTQGRNAGRMEPLYELRSAA